MTTVAGVMRALQDDGLPVITPLNPRPDGVAVHFPLGAPGVLVTVKASTRADLDRWSIHSGRALRDAGYIVTDDHEGHLTVTGFRRQAKNTHHYLANDDGTRTCTVHDVVVYPDELGCGE